MKSQKIIILILSLIIIVLSYLYINLKTKTDVLLESKNFNMEWSSNGEILYNFWKKNNKISNQYVDKNYDSNYEIIINYDAFGNLYQKNYDFNENGIFESCESFDIYGKKVGYSFDRDEDGTAEEFTIILDNKNEVRFLDVDNNGRYKKIQLIDKEKNSISEKLTIDLFK